MKKIFVIGIIVCLLGMSSYLLYDTIYIPYVLSQKLAEVRSRIPKESGEFFPEAWEAIAQSADRETVEKEFVDDLMSHYQWDVRNKKIYMARGNFKDNALMDGVDYDTFVPLQVNYSKDKNYLYSDQKKTNFDLNLHPKLLGVGYIVDDNHVYDLGHEILTGIDRATFEVIYTTGGLENRPLYYGKDKNNYYLRGKIYTGKILGIEK